MKHIGLVLVNTREEFDSLEAPQVERYKHVHQRKVTVSRHHTGSSQQELKKQSRNN